MSGANEGEPMARPSRPQYHFFYGSTEDGSHSDMPANGSVQQEQESLIGESLVPTDNEEEPPNSNEYDLQHVLISNGNGMRHVVGGDKRAKASKNGYQNGEHDRPSGFFQALGSSLINMRENHPVVHIASLVGCMTICMVVFAVVLFPSTTQNAADALSSPLSPKFVLKFPVVDRSKSNDPVSAFLNKDLFHPSLLYKGNDPFREFNFAFPTGAFWTNLVLPPTADQGFSYPIAVYPYAYKWSEYTMAVSYPAMHRKEEPKAIHDYFFPDLTFGTTEEVRQRQITDFDPLSVSLTFHTANRGHWNSYLVQGSPYVTIEYDNVTPIIKALSIFKSVLCPGEEGFDNKGSDDFDDSFTDDDAHSGRRRKLFGVCSSSSDGDSTVLRGVQFILQSQEGVNWIVFSSEPVSFIYDTRRKTDIFSAKAFKGTIRLAVIPPSSKLKSTSNGIVEISSSTGLRRLVYHAGVYPVGAKVDYDFRDPSSAATTDASKKLLSALTGGGGGNVGPNPKVSKPRIASVHFTFTTEAINSNTNIPSSASGKATGLLMLALPHHAVSFTDSHMLDSKHFDLVYQCIKGNMTPVVGSSWTYEEPLLSLGFEHNIPGVKETLADTTIRRLMAQNLEEDLKIALPTRDENIYGFGKQVARIAQLAHISHELLGVSSGRASTSNATQSGNIVAIVDDKIVALHERAVGMLSNYLDLLLTNQLADSLLYDASLGGLVSTDGLSDWNADFGNGRYNDHHFHYGYLLYACAIMGNLNRTFVEQHGESVDAILHDVAYNSKVNDGSFFPLARHFSWFDGHSFASGLFPFGNGKSQESSSEAVNCYYGAYLWTMIRSAAQKDSNSDTTPMSDFSRMLLAMEVRGAKTYWHMVPPTAKGISNTTISAIPTVYNPEFAKNYMVGNLGMLDAICSTWFGTQNLYVHMINFLPVTSITKELFERDYVKNEYADVISQYPDAEMAWRGYVVADHALIDPMKAWEEAQDLKSFQLDAGISKSQILYFVMTSPVGFNVSQISKISNLKPVADNSGIGSKGSNSDSGASCTAHEACRNSGLGGLCCPTSDGAFLACCNARRR